MTGRVSQLQKSGSDFNQSHREYKWRLPEGVANNHGGSIQRRPSWRYVPRGANRSENGRFQLHWGTLVKKILSTDRKPLVRQNSETRENGSRRQQGWNGQAGRLNESVPWFIDNTRSIYEFPTKTPNKNRSLFHFSHIFRLTWMNSFFDCIINEN